MPRVVIVGAGPAGLSVAFRLTRLVTGLDVTVLEADTKPGGKVGTLNIDGFRVETGPNGFLDSKPGMVDLCRDLGLSDRLIAASEGSRKNRYVFVRNQIHKLPGSPLSLLTTPLLSVAGKLALLAEPFRRRSRQVPSDESVAAFARRRFGLEAADIFIDALVTGIHAGDPEKLSVQAAFPRLATFEAEAGSVIRGVLRAGRVKKRETRARGAKPMPTRMWSFAGGLGAVIDTLVAQPGFRLITSAPVKHLERSAAGWLVRGEREESWPADAVVLTAPAFEQAALLEPHDPGLAVDLAGIAYNPVAVVALGYRQTDAPGSFDGFGYIAPQNTKRDILGVQWCSSIFPDRAPPGCVLWRILCGGASRPEMAHLADDALVRACHAEMKLALGVTGEPIFRHIIRWPRAIPQYHLGHPARVERIEAAVARLPGLAVTGNALHGVALNDVVERAAGIAERVAEWVRWR